jgi:ABC-type amino acid transport substrate-binding protein
VIIRLYVDEDAQDRDLVRSLLARGVDVVTASDAGMIERPDEEHLDYATASGRALFSFNVSDFYRSHTEYVARGKSHGGIILTQQQRYSVGEQMRRILKLIATKPAEEMVNQIEFLGVWG